MMSQEHKGLLKYAKFSFSNCLKLRIYCRFLFLMLIIVFSQANATFTSFLFGSNECGSIYPSKIKAVMHRNVLY